MGEQEAERMQGQFKPPLQIIVKKNWQPSWLLIVMWYVAMILIAELLSRSGAIVVGLIGGVGGWWLVRRKL